MGGYGEKAFVNSGVIGRSSKARQLSSILEERGIWGKVFIESGNVQSKRRRLKERGCSSVS